MSSYERGRRGAYGGGGSSGSSRDDQDRGEHLFNSLKYLVKRKI